MGKMGVTMGGGGGGAREEMGETGGKWVGMGAKGGNGGEMGRHQFACTGGLPCYGTTPPPPPPTQSAQISATTKRGCRPWAGSPWGPGNWGADFLLPLPPPPAEMGWDQKQTRTPPPPPRMPSHPHCRPMVNEVPPLAEKERTLNDEYVGIWDPHGNPAGGPPLPNK